MLALLLALTLPTIDQWIALPGLSSPSLSPDGRQVIWVATRADWEADRRRDDLWIASTTGGGDARVLVRGPHSNYGVRWSRDGKSIAFVSTRDGAPQIYGLSPAAPEKINKLTSAKNGVGGIFAFSPDGRSIAYTSPGDAPEPRGFTIVGEEPPVNTRLWVMPLGGEPKVLTPESLSVESFDWSPDGTRIAFSATPDTDVNSWSKSEVYLVPAAGGELARVTNRDGYDSGPLWSPDGTSLAYVRSREPWSPTRNGQVAVTTLATGATRVLTENFDEGAIPIAWRAEGIYFVANERTAEHLYCIDGDRITRVTGGNGVHVSFDFAGGTMAFTRAAGSELTEVFVSPIARYEPRKLSDASAAIRGTAHATREVISWTSRDGTPIEGVLIKPHDFDPRRRYPLFVVIHTGPIAVAQPVITHDLPYPVEMLAARGALVLQPNYRGSDGYGEQFRSMLLRNLGQPQIDDIVSGVDLLVAQGHADPKRVGAMGWSHGGYLAALIATTSDRFAAVSVGAGVSDWVTFYTLSDSGPWTIPYVGGTPWDVPDAYRAIAPLTYVKRAHTPTLIQHGENDRRAPIAGSYELYRALRDQGVPVRMIVYTKAGHAGRSFGLSQFRSVVQHNIDWFEKWVLTATSSATRRSGDPRPTGAPDPPASARSAGRR